ncbi:MAG: hypothetical protein ACP5O8_02440 [Candidatus Aenigmatarchaeota archaeon]
MVKCPECGSENTTYDEINEVWLCNNPRCGIAFKGKPPLSIKLKKSFLGLFKKKEGESEEESKKKEIVKFSTSILLRAFIFFGIIAIFVIGVLSSLLGRIQQEILKFFPDFPTLQYLPYAIFFILASYAAYKFAQKSLFMGFIYCFIFIIAAILISALIIELPKIFPGFNQTIILDQNGLPEPIKSGGYYTVNFKWGSEETNFEEKFPRPIRKDSETIYSYSFPVTVENPSRKKTVKDFYFLPGTGLYNTSDMLFHELYPNLCREDKKCEIAPLDSYVITFSSNGNINYRINTLRIKINTSLSSASFGNNTFVFIRSLEDEKIAPTYKPYTSEGPVDITVYFAPVKYNFEYMNDEKVRIVIQLRNKGDGIGRIKKIFITRVGNQKLLEKPQTCEGVGGEYLLSSLDERNEYFELISPLNLASSPLVFFCEYIVPEEIRNNKISSPFETITFIASAEYTYERIYEKEVRAMIIT